MNEAESEVEMHYLNNSIKRGVKGCIKSLQAK